MAKWLLIEAFFCKVLGHKACMGLDIGLDQELTWDLEWRMDAIFATIQGHRRKISGCKFLHVSRRSNTAIKLWMKLVASNLDLKTNMCRERTASIEKDMLQ